MADGSPEENIDTKQISEPGDIYKYVDVEALEEEQRAKRRKKRLEEEAKRNKNKRDKKPKIQSSPPDQADKGGQVKTTASAIAEKDRPKMEPHPPDEAPPIFVPRPYDPENPEAIFDNARMFIESDLGLRSPNLLADDDKFVHITPKVDEIGPQNKKEYLAAGRFFDLRSTFPDLDYRAHDFRLVDELDEEGAFGSERQNNNTVSVRLTLRATGTMTNELRLRRKTLPPTDAKMICPPEAVTITFDKKTGKVTKLCSGFVMDRLVGNTDGLCGVQAAATIAGDQPSDWEVFPPPLVLSRIFGRPVQRLEEPKSLDAPFPEGVLISLAKGVIAADNGVKDQSVLDPSFSFCSPLVNPINKKDFLDVLEGFDLKEAFPDLQTKYTNFRVDPFDPYRVWVDGLGSGTWTGPLMGKSGNGVRYKGSPEAISLTFNNQGLCTRLTAGLTMDPTKGNTDGLGGVLGTFYATNSVLPGFSSRPLPNVLARAAEKMCAKPTDDGNASKEPEEPKPQIDDSELIDDPAQGPESKVKKTDAQKVAAPKFELPKIGLPNLPSLNAGPQRPSQTKGSESATRKSEETSEPKSSEEFLARLKEDAEAKKAKAEERILQLELEAKETRLREEAKRRAASIDTKRRAEDAKKKVAEERRRQTEEQRRAAEVIISAAAEEKKEPEQPVIKTTPGNNTSFFSNLFGASRSLKRSQAESAKQALVEDTADEKSKQGAAKKVAGTKKKRDATAKREEGAPKKGPVVVKKSATISLSSLFTFQSPSPAPRSTRSDAPPALESSKPKPLITAPRGIPTLSKYRRNRDGSITAYIFNSSSFEDGKMITTSPVNTKISPGTIVETSSGSKYFLDPGKDIILKEYQGKNKKNLQAKPKRGAAIPEIVKKSPTIPGPSTETPFRGPKSRATFSLFGLGEGQKTSQKQTEPSLRPATKQPNRFNRKSANVPTDVPPGTPKVIDWKQNFDGSISGFVVGSNNFVEGERIVTSPLQKGEVVESESIVTTVSGSQYYLV